MSVDKITNPFYAFGVLYKSDNFIEWEKNQSEKFKAYRKAWVDRVYELDTGRAFQVPKPGKGNSRA